MTCIGVVEGLAGRDLRRFDVKRFTFTKLMTFEQDFFRTHFFYAIRLIGALLLVTLVPLLIDRRFRR
ncbi:MAG TPA: hypothetical protein VK571_08175 [Gemmatimonadaceae bacterium]|nr:hypothetical protein [Gemmatimonadaceae bacterium]